MNFFQVHPEDITCFLDFESAALVKQLKKVWVASNESVAVCRCVGSGPPQIVTVAGLKELAGNFHKPITESFNTANVDRSCTRYLANYAGAVENRRSEMLFLRADLSFK